MLGLPSRSWQSTPNKTYRFGVMSTRLITQSINSAVLRFPVKSKRFVGVPLNPKHLKGDGWEPPRSFLGLQLPRWDSLSNGTPRSKKSRRSPRKINAPVKGITSQLARLSFLVEPISDHGHNQEVCTRKKKKKTALVPQAASHLGSFSDPNSESLT